MDQDTEIKLVELLRNHRTAALGTLREGYPLVTMVLFILKPDFSAFYIDTSKLAQHTQDIQKNPHVSLMVAEADLMQELDPQLLARVSLRGEAEQVTRESQEFELVRRQYLEKYPQSAYTFQLGDFSFYRISPKVARYVAGFAKAFNLAAIDLVRIAEKYP